MKKIVFLLMILTAVILITRFVNVSNPIELGSAPPRDCDNGQASASASGISCDAITEIKNEYETEVRPIFEQKCLACHGLTKKLPLYAKIPPVSWLVLHDMKEAKEDINMTWDFPFIDKKGIAHSLKETIEVVEENSMPPWYYKIMHWKSGLTSEEKQTILNWAKQSQKKINP